MLRFYRFLAVLIFMICGTRALASDVLTGSAAFGDWRQDVPGVTRLIKPADLPPPYQTHSAGNSPQEVSQPDGAKPGLPPGFSVEQVAGGLDHPRILRTAPNGDVFVAETGAGQIRVLRLGVDGKQTDHVFADGLNIPFGIAFYPQGSDPRWVYVANTGSVIRFPYRSGDLTASGKPETVIPRLPSGGGHVTRDIAFSPDGKALYVSVGSGSNVAEDLDEHDAGFIEDWQAKHGLGAAWADEADRADVLIANPDGSNLRSFANGIRNCVGLAVQPGNGTLWCATNECDGLGDNLPPDYVTSVKQGAFYGWPWYYIGNHEDPRHAGERPDLAAHVTVPDVLIQPHSAPLGITFYEGGQFPAEYRGDAFVALHGSWNRAKRTGYKIVRILFKNGQPTGAYQDFMTGLVAGDRSVWARPVGIAVLKDGSMLVSEDAGGTVWRIRWTGR